MNSKLVVVYPNMAGNGAKFMAMNLAHYYKELYPLKNVAVVDFNLKKPGLGDVITDDEIHGIDNLLEQIDGNTLTTELFEQNMVITKDNLAILKGTQICQPRLFSQKHIQTVLEYLRNMYDMVFVAVSSEMDNTATIASIFEADEVLLVVKNNRANFKVLAKNVEAIDIYRTSQKKLKLVYNIYSQASPTDFGTLIREKNLEVLGIIDYDENAIDNIDLVNTTGSKFFKSKNKSADSFYTVLKSL